MFVVSQIISKVSNLFSQIPKEQNQNRIEENIVVNASLFSQGSLLTGLSSPCGCIF